MKKYFILLAIVTFITLTGCEVVGGIFKAGVWSGIIMVVIVIAVVIYLISRFNRKS